MSEHVAGSSFSASAAREWLARWDRQQEGYVRGRAARFSVMAELVREVAGDAPLILDLGCDPGSLTARLLDAIPGATLVSIDIDPLLLAVGRAALDEHRDRVTWADADLADGSWREALAGRSVDAAVSTTALHRLQADVLLGLYRDLVGVVREGGVFLNGDHMDYGPAKGTIGAVTRAIRDRRTSAALREPGVEDAAQWDAAIGLLPEAAPLIAERNRRFAAKPSCADRWHTTYELHRAGLPNAGFREVATAWQDLDNRVLMAIR